MKYIVAFSGGFDSTYLLSYLLENKPDATICAVSIENNNLLGSIKMEKEREARKQLEEYFKDYYREADLHFTTISTNFYGSDKPLERGSYTSHLTQPVFWLMTIAPLLQSGDIICLGYIKGDSALGVIDGINHIVKGINEIQTREWDDDKIKVHLPLQGYSKSTIIELLIAQYGVDFLDMCISCETYMDESNKWCGQCHTCASVKSALIELIMRNHVHKDALRELYKKWFRKDLVMEVDVKED